MARMYDHMFDSENPEEVNLEHTVKVCAREYAELRADQAILESLRGHGVENWEFYDRAMGDVEAYNYE